MVKIPFTEIFIGKAPNIEDKFKNAPNMAKVLEQIKVSQLHRVRESIDLWRAAIDRAESVLNPDRTELIRLYRDITLDGHLTSLMSTYSAAIMSSPYFIVNAKGEVDDEITKRFRAEWFEDFLQASIEADFYGFSPIQFGDIKDDHFTSASIIKREYVIPEKKAVKRSLFTNGDLLYLDAKPYNVWTLLIDNGDLGLLAKAAPYILYKKAVTGAWSEAAEVFGMPMRVGKTDINVPTKYANMTTMLREMGSSAWAVLDTEDEIEFVEAARSDYYQVYDKLIERANSELSKLFLGQTMTADNGSSRSQAEVHKEIFELHIYAAKRKTANNVNGRLLPLLWYHNILPSGYSFKWDDEQKVDIDTKFGWAKELIASGKYKIEAEWIEQTFGVPVEEIEEPETDPRAAAAGESVMPKVENLYEEAKESHKH